MHTQPVHPNPLYQLIPIAIILVVLALRFRRLTRERPLRIERLWIVPALYLAITAFTFWNIPPAPMTWAAAAAALLAGAALGWQRGRMMHIQVNPETHEISQRGSLAAMAFILALVLIRSLARNADSLGIPGMHFDVMAMTDVLIAFALGMLTVQRVEMFLRARRLLEHARGHVLEIASGSGEHCAFFAGRFADLVWQPSDPDADALASIADWCAGLANVRAPLEIDAATGAFPAADAILCVNMVHISPWEATLGLLAGAGTALAPGAPLILYGPYRREGVATAPSNEQFELWLKDRDSRFGLRFVEAVTAAAAPHGLSLERLVEMPANNLMLVYRRA